MKVSIIAWDANFRENLHTIDCFAKQVFPSIDFEFIWVDYYRSNKRVKQKIEQYENFKLVTLNNENSEEWHLGQCINAGVSKSMGDLLVIPDGDIVVEANFLEYVVNQCNLLNHITYFRRYDELECDACLESSTIKHLAQYSSLLAPVNYAGCMVLRKEDFLKVNGYEEHSVFSGPGMNAMEMNIRLRNFGMYIRFSEKKIYHPWHVNTGISNEDKRQRAILKLAKNDYPWIVPYSGIKQSWVTYMREKEISIEANIKDADLILSKLPLIDLLKYENYINLLKENHV